MKVLGLIPARGGSKSIPKKNIKIFCGKPLIAWKIEAAIKSGVIGRLIVSTDDQEIAEVARHFGAEAPFLRPAELAEDTTPTLPVVQHALSWFRQKEDYHPDIAMLLEPTSPSVQPFHIREALDLFVKTGADSVVSVVEVPAEYHPYWQFTIGEHDRLALFAGESIRQIVSRRQDLPKTYHRNGVLYVFKPGLVFDPNPSIYGDDIRAYLMDPQYSSDINNAEDWSEAEDKMRTILERQTERLRGH
ncbi:acylneuraminate cytidylyltransferase family protein [Candidatus Uhrbacteria bacterium]|nr:acylneuraminate cytidylyltransferase family protein [Candidatus Uhrbacteria bacterium]